LHDLAATDLQQARRAFELRYWAALALLNTEARVFERVLSCSPPELPGKDHIRDGWLLRASAEQSRP
jgi:hypothetical protein